MNKYLQTLLIFFFLICSSLYSSQIKINLTTNKDNTLKYSFAEGNELFELGTLIFDKIIIYELFFFNIDKEHTMEIKSLVSNCSCITIEGIVPSKLLPHESFSVLMKVNTGSNLGTIIRDISLNINSNGASNNLRIPFLFSIAEMIEDINFAEAPINNAQNIAINSKSVLDNITIIPSNIIDFGVHNISQRQVCTIQLNNVSDEVIKLGPIRTSCSCIEAKLSKFIIEPKGNIHLTVTLRDGELQGKYSQNVYIMLENMDKKYLKIDINGISGKIAPKIEEKIEEKEAILSNKNAILIEYFHRSDCMECAKLLRAIKFNLNKIPHEKYQFIAYDLSEEVNFKNLLTRLEALGDNSSNEKAYIFLNRTVIIAGPKAIRQNLIDNMEKLSLNSNSQILLHELDNFNDEQLVGRIRLGIVLIAGFIDGLNPCVFATLIFLMSLLIGMRTNNIKNLILIGVVYSFACFITYFSIGFGLLKVIGWFIGGFPILRMILNMFIALALLVVGVLSFVDAISFFKNGNSGKIIVKLPINLKNKIHSLLRNLRYSKLFLPSVFIVGVIVTVIESVCSGQVYVPTLLLLIAKEGVTSEWFIYLILYNIMFIIPLLLLLVLTCGGISVISLAKLGKKELMIGKILVGILFFLLAIILVYFEFF